DAPVVRADLQEAEGQPRRVRREQGPLRRDPALRDHVLVVLRVVMTPLAGRVAVVTGGTGALGQAVTMRLLADGAIVAVPYAVEEERERRTQRVADDARPGLILQTDAVIGVKGMAACA